MELAIHIAVAITLLGLVLNAVQNHKRINQLERDLSEQIKR